MISGAGSFLTMTETSLGADTPPSSFVAVIVTVYVPGTSSLTTVSKSLSKTAVVGLALILAWTSFRNYVSLIFAYFSYCCAVFVLIVAIFSFSTCTIIAVGVPATPSLLIEFSVTV